MTNWFRTRLVALSPAQAALVVAVFFASACASALLLWWFTRRNARASQNA